MNIRKSICAAILLAAAAFSFAKVTTQELTKKYLELANSQAETENFTEAFNNVNAALKLNEQDGIPANAALVSVQVYIKVLENIKATGDYSKLPEIESYVNHFSVLNDVRIKSALEEIKAIKQSKEASAQDKMISTMVMCVLIVCVILIFIFILILIIIKVASQNQKTQVKQFEETLKLVAGMQQQNSQLLLGSVTDLHGLEHLKSAGSSRWGVDALPSPEMNDEEKEELKQLAILCEDLGSKVDMVTNRKNNSKNVSEMVYKLALALGCNQNTAMAYFCASMVYDAGFLAIPAEMLGADSLTEQEKEVIHDHVNKTEEYFEFVPPTYKKIFEDAAMFHHENEDGSGYPNGITGKVIPQVAKLIHVVESYNSLISRRNYKTIMDKESAVEELLSKPELYDAAVVKALDSIV